QRGLALREAGETLLELDVDVESAVEEPRAGAAGAVDGERGGGALLHLGVSGQPEVVVRAEHDDGLAVEHDDRVLAGGDGPVEGHRVHGPGELNALVCTALREDVQP